MNNGNESNNSSDDLNDELYIAVESAAFSHGDELRTYLQTINTVLHSGADINSVSQFATANETPLGCAIRNNNVNLIRFLLGKGATVKSNHMRIATARIKRVLAPYIAKISGIKRSRSGIPLGGARITRRKTRTVPYRTTRHRLKRRL